MPGSPENVLPKYLLSVTCTVSRKGEFDQFNILTVGASGSFTATKETIPVLTALLVGYGASDIGLSKCKTTNEKKTKILLAFPGLLTLFIGSCRLPPHLKAISDTEMKKLKQFFKSSVPTFRSDSKGALIATNIVLKEAKKWFKEWKSVIGMILGQNFEKVNFEAQGFCLIGNTNNNKVTMLRLYVVSYIAMLYTTKLLGGEKIPAQFLITKST